MQAQPTFDWAIFRQYSWKASLKDQPPIYNRPVATFESALASFCEMNAPWTVTCPIWKKSFIAELKGFDESFTFMEDPELHVRALLKQKQLPFINNQDPPDSFYRRDNITREKQVSFYENSILSRIQFVRKLLTYTEIQPYYAAIRRGFMNFIKVLVLSRFQNFKSEVLPVVALLSAKKVLRRYDIYRIRLAAYVYAKENSVVKALRLKGLIYRIFFMWGD